jgi:hypothetical protein
MRKSRFSATQIAEILKEGEAGVSVIEVLNEIVARRPRWGFPEAARSTAAGWASC